MIECLVLVLLSPAVNTEYSPVTATSVEQVLDRVRDTNDGCTVTIRQSKKVKNIVVKTSWEIKK